MAGSKIIAVCATQFDQDLLLIHSFHFRPSSSRPSHHLQSNAELLCCRLRSRGLQAAAVMQPFLHAALLHTIMSAIKFILITGLESKFIPGEKISPQSLIFLTLYYSLSDTKQTRTEHS